MILDTHTAAKVLTRTYQRTLAEVTIDRNRVSPSEEEWLDIPASVGTGKYDDERRGWMAAPDWRGTEHRFTTADLPVTKRRWRWT